MLLKMGNILRSRNCFRIVTTSLAYEYLSCHCKVNGRPLYIVIHLLENCANEIWNRRWAAVIRDSINRMHGIDVLFRFRYARIRMSRSVWLKGPISYAPMNRSHCIESLEYKCDKSNCFYTNFIIIAVFSWFIYSHRVLSGGNDKLIMTAYCILFPKLQRHIGFRAIRMRIYYLTKCTLNNFSDFSNRVLLHKMHEQWMQWCLPWDRRPLHAITSHG